MYDVHDFSAKKRQRRHKILKLQKCRAIPLIKTLRSEEVTVSRKYAGNVNLGTHLQKNPK